MIRYQIGRIIKTVRYIPKDISDCFLSLFVRKKLLVASCRYTKVCKRDCYKGVFKKFMVRKPGIHGHYHPKEEKACYNKPRN